MVRQVEIEVGPYPKGMHPITGRIVEAIGRLPRTGILNVFLRHTSAALAISENADPDVGRDMDGCLDRLIPENQPYFTHTAEGGDDMPAHIKSVLTGVSLTVPVVDGKLALGRWQGIFLCEYRRSGGARKLVITTTGDENRNSFQKP